MFVNFKRELKSFGSPLHFDLVCFRTTFDFRCFVICTFVCNNGNNCNVIGTPVKCNYQIHICNKLFCSNRILSVLLVPNFIKTVSLCRNWINLSSLVVYCKYFAEPFLLVILYAFQETFILFVQTFGLNAMDDAAAMLVLLFFSLFFLLKSLIKIQKKIQDVPLFVPYFDTFYFWFFVGMYQ